MANTTEVADAREARRIQCEELLSRYAALSAQELADFKHWFMKEASAYETAILSTKDAISEQYRAFKAEHVDPFTWRDYAFMAVFWLFMVGVVLGNVFLGQ